MTAQMDVTGFFIIRVRKNKTDGLFRWYLKHQTTHNGKTVEIAVSKDRLHLFGFNQSMTVLEVKERVKRLNRERTIKGASGQIRAANRAEEGVRTNETFFPQDRINEFLVYLEEKTHGTEYRFKKVLSHFAAAQELILDTKLFPNEYAYRASKIYKWFVKRKYSLDYTRSILRVLNLWGLFEARRQGQFFEPILNPKGVIRANINQAQRTKEGRRTESAPMTVEVLIKLKDGLGEKRYNWMYVSFYLGLRPSEVDVLSREGVTTEEVEGVIVLLVDQPKLSGLDIEKRMKRIPLILEEQIVALKLLKERRVERPRAKQLKLLLKGNYSTYSGRKGFTDLMLSRGQLLEDISLWMGHSSIERTWRSYKNKRKVKWTKVG